MKYIKNGTKWLLFFLMVAALGALTSCAAEQHAAMSAHPGPAPHTGPATAAPAVQARPSLTIHASNDKNTAPEIGWVPWSDAAFATARAENKLVFLEISSEWSAWPGQQGSFPSDPETAGIIEKNYIPVYVDADRRPDVYEQYGRGGLPSLSILNPDGYILASANAMTAPELKNLIATLAKNYEKNKSLIDEALKSSSSNVTRSKPPKEEYPLEKMPEGTLAALAAQWDPVYGGVGRKKFPMPEALDFLLYASVHPKYQDGIDPKPLAQAALNGMAAGLFDRTEGGFFRYSDTPDWKSPHKEKLLGLNSALIITYLRAYETYGNEEYLRIAESTAGFLRKYLLDTKTGAFMNSRSEGRSTDRTVFADENGKAALAFLEAYRVTGKREYLSTALNSLDYVINNLYNEKVGVAHFAGETGGMLALSDQVWPSLAAARAYQVTADAKYLDFAVKITKICDKKFYDPKDFGFYGFWYAETPPGLLKNIKKPQAENAKMSELLLTLHYLTGSNEYRETAKKTILPFVPAYRKYPEWSAPVATAAAKLTSSTCQFFVVGRKSEPGFSELLIESYRFEDPDRVVVPLEADRDKDRIKGLGYGHENTPMLYVCSDIACFSPIRPGESMESVRALLKKCKEAERQKYGR
jgi:uncharacterized protein YyaL (SSP411 family)